MITYAVYKDFGYSLIPEAEFSRYEMKAELTVKKYTFGRLSEDNISDYNKHGICEIAELYYSDLNQLNKQVMSYSTGKVSETYALPSTVTEWTIEEKAYSVIMLYFTNEQLYRGADNYAKNT